MEIHIRPADPADAPAILALQKAAYQQEAERYNDFTIPPLTQSLPDLAAEISTGVFLKALDGRGRLVGSVRACEKEETVHIGRLIVAPDCQRKGIGTRLMAAVEAGFPGAKRFELFTGHKSRGNIRLYQRLGYRTCRTEQLTPKVGMVFLEK